jgi:hypothetical protein
MIFNMVVLSEYEDESMMGAVTNPLSTWKRDLPKGLNSQGELSHILLFAATAL